MDLKRGRLIDHLHLRTRELKASQAFYTATLKVLGIEVVVDDTHLQADELWIDAGPESSHVHFAFQAPDRETVDRWHAAGLEAGGKDNGAPGERPYHLGYYAAFLLDPDGNNVEAVFHGVANRSADAVTISFDAPK